MASGKKSSRPTLESPSLLFWVLAADATLVAVAYLALQLEGPKLLFLHGGLFSALAFGLFGLDKQLARSAKRRVSETNLLATSALGGALGALVAMTLFRHKTQHAVFKVGVPVFLFVHVVILALAFTDSGPQA